MTGFFLSPCRVNLLHHLQQDFLKLLRLLLPLGLGAHLVLLSMCSPGEQVTASTDV